MLFFFILSGCSRTIWQPRFTLSFSCSLHLFLDLSWSDSELYVLFLTLNCLVCCCFQSGKPRGRQHKVPKHTVDSGGVINISDDSSSDSDGMDTDSNSSPDSLLDNDDVIFVNHTSCQTGRRMFVSFLRQTRPVIFVTLACWGYMFNVPSASCSQPG